MGIIRRVSIVPLKHVFYNVDACSFRALGLHLAVPGRKANIDGFPTVCSAEGNI